MGIAIFQKNKGLLSIAVFTSTILFIFLIDTNPPPFEEFVTSPIWADIKFEPQGIENLKIQKWWQLKNNMKNLSKLGEVLFLQKPEPKIVDPDKKYLILVWKYGPTIENRHLKHFSGNRIDPFGHCPVKNCDITYSESNLTNADIVIFHLHRTKSPRDIPKRKDLNQIWAFLTDESPYNTFLNHKNKLKDYNGIFNWSMTFRTDADIPVPYGRTVLKKQTETNLEELNVIKRRDVLVAILGSNCGGQNHRWQYVAELQKYIQVDVYGGCGKFFKQECPGHFGSDCPAIDQYLFYLSFENSNCDQYITEKLWWNAYHKNSIPVVMGSSQETYKRLLPLDSYINIDDFASPGALAEYLYHLNKTEGYRLYYNWKKNFEIVNEHGYFQSKSYHYCRICQALNYNAKDKKVYSDLENFWSANKDCHPAWDAWKD